jgi:hypothetical protein
MHLNGDELQQSFAYFASAFVRIANNSSLKPAAVHSSGSVFWVVLAALLAPVAAVT